MRNIGAQVALEDKLSRRGYFCGGEVVTNGPEGIGWCSRFGDRNAIEPPTLFVKVHGFLEVIDQCLGCFSKSRKSSDFPFVSQRFVAQNLGYA